MRSQSIRILLSAAACSVALLGASSAYADLFPNEFLLKKDRENVAGGQGTVSGRYAFFRDNAKKEEAVKEISWLTLPPGSSIGYHKHINNEDAYIIVSGTGMFRDADGKDYPVKKGDVLMTRKGQSHGLTNNGTEPLVFVDVIAEQ